MSYYVYVYLDPRKPGKYYEGLNYSFLFEPFYVGKGKNKRCYQHLELKDNSNTFKNGRISHIINEGFYLKDYIVLVEINLVEDDAFVIEKEVINAIGRYDLKKGPLTNLVDGGKGSYSDGDKNPMYRKPAHNKGKPLSVNQKKKLSIAKSKKIKQIDKITNEVLHIWDNAQTAAFELGISKSTIHAVVCPGQQNLYGGGFKWEYLDKPNIKYENIVNRTCRGASHIKSKKFKILNHNTGNIFEIIGLRNYCKNNNLDSQRLRWTLTRKEPYMNLQILEIV